MKHVNERVYLADSSHIERLIMVSGRLASVYSPWGGKLRTERLAALAGWQPRQVLDSDRRSAGKHCLSYKDSQDTVAS